MSVVPRNQPLDFKISFPMEALEEFHCKYLHTYNPLSDAAFGGRTSTDVGQTADKSSKGRQNKGKNHHLPPHCTHD